MMRRGFTAVELLITLFVASVFLGAGYTLFSFVIRDSGEVRATVKASSVARDYLDQFSLTEGDCEPSTPMTNESVDVEGLTNVRVSVVISCPNPATPSLGLVEVTVAYNSPEKTVSLSGYSQGTGIELAAPTITQQPENEYVYSGDTVTFSVQATAYPAFSVQWEMSTNKGVSWSAIDGASSIALSFPSVPTMDGNRYRAVLTNSEGEVTTEDVAVFVADRGWNSLPLLNGWVRYDNNYTAPMYRRTIDGVVIVKGMIKSGSLGVVANLPEGYRPKEQHIFSTGSSSNASGARIDVFPSGNIGTSTGVTSGWVSLDVIKFLPDNGRYEKENVSPLSNGWSNYGNNHSTAGYTVDDAGRVHVDGVLVPGTITNGTQIFDIPDALLPSHYLHYPVRSSSFSLAGVERRPEMNTGIVAKGVGSGYFTLQTMYYPASVGSWNNLSLLAGWTWYDGGSGMYSTPQYTKSSDGIVTLKGLIRSGTTTGGVVIATLPEGYRPTERILSTAVTSNAYGRVDVLSNGNVLLYNASASWFSLDNVSFYAGDSSYMDGLVAWWPMNGNANDVQGNNDGTVSGASLTNGKSGEPNGAYSFDGINDKITVADNSSIDIGSEITESAWIRPSSCSANSTIATKNLSYYLQLHSNCKLAVYTYPGAGGSSTYDYSSSTIPMDTWTHVVFTENTAGLRSLYINGQLDFSISREAGIYMNNGAFTMGGQEDNYRYYSGAIDDVRLFNRALSAAEVQQLYEAGAI